MCAWIRRAGNGIGRQIGNAPARTVMTLQREESMAITASSTGKKNDRNAEMKAKPLTKAEKEWLNKLQALLDACPSKRLGAFTIGDPFLQIYDSTFEQQINAILDCGTKDFCTAVREVGAELETLITPFPVHSTAG